MILYQKLICHDLEINLKHTLKRRMKYKNNIYQRLIYNIDDILSDGTFLYVIIVPSRIKGKKLRTREVLKNVVINLE